MGMVTDPFNYADFGISCSSHPVCVFPPGIPGTYGCTCGVTYPPLTSIVDDLTATPGSGSTFAGWSGACTNTTGTCTVTIDTGRSVTATFNPIITSYTLAVTKAGNGTGTVTSTPAGINCGAVCSGDYASGTVVTLTPTADAGSTFAGWSGDADCADGQVTLSAAKTCTATFNLIPVTYSLTVTKAGTGSGRVTSIPAGIDCGAACSVNYDSGMVVMLTATADAGSTFMGWSGDADCSDGSVILSTAKTCTATFNLILVTYRLTVTKAGTGSGTVTSSPAGIDCGAACSEDYPSGTEVMLTPTADAGSTFASWSGDADCSDGSVTLSAAKTCTATFRLAGPVIVEFPFEDDGGMTTDKSGNGDDGIVNGALFLTGGGISGSNAYQFSWSSQNNIRIPYQPSQAVSDALTVEAWIYPTAWDNIYAGYNRIVSKYPSYLLRGVNGRAHFNILTQNHGYQDVISSNVTAINQWHYLVGTFDGRTLKLYVDGVERKTLTLPENDTLMDNQADIYVGEYPRLNEGFTGIIDNVALYRKVRTATEIQQTYNSIIPQPACATDVSTQVSVTRGGFRFNRATGRFGQVITLANTGATPVQDTVSLVLDNLSSNAMLYNKTGSTTCAVPAGSSYIDVTVGSDNILSPGESATVTLEFTNSNNQGITYNTRVLTGSGSH